MSWKPSTVWTVGIMAGWLLLVAIAQTGMLDEQGTTNGRKYGLAMVFLYGGPVLAIWNWLYLRKQEKAAEQDRKED